MPAVSEPGPFPERHGLYRRMGIAALIVAGGTLLSRVLGLLRQVVFAWLLGAGAAGDEYFVAFVIPDFLNHLLAGAYMAITLIPILTRRFAAGDEEDAWRAFWAVARVLVIGSVRPPGRGHALHLPGPAHRGAGVQRRPDRRGHPPHPHRPARPGVLHPGPAVHRRAVRPGALRHRHPGADHLQPGHHPGGHGRGPGAGAAHRRGLRLGSPRRLVRRDLRAAVVGSEALRAPLGGRVRCAATRRCPATSPSPCR